MASYVNLDTIQRPSGGANILSAWGDQVNDNFAVLAFPPICRVHRTAGYTTTSGVFTLYPFDTVDTDTASGFNTSTSKYTVPVAGSYLVHIGLSLGSVADGAYAIADIFQNTSQIAETRLSAGGANIMQVPCSAILSCAAGDTIYAEYYTGTAAAINGVGFNWMHIVQVSH